MADDIQEQLVSIMAQHSSYLYRASTATVNQVLALIDETGIALTRDIRDRLENLAPAELAAFAAGRYTTTRLEGLRNDIEAWAAALDAKISAMFAADGEALAGYEASYIVDLLSQDGGPEVAISSSVAYEAALAKPVLGELVEDMLSGIADRAKRQVYATVRQGVAEGRTNTEIVRSLRGTKELNYKDGILQTAKTNAETVVRTARAHISNVAYDEAYRALGVKRLVWSAMLEMRTCHRCASLDRKEFDIDKPHPKNPLHPRCRCQLVPRINDELMGDRPFVLAGKVTGRDGVTGYRSVGQMTQKQRRDAGLEIGQVRATTSFSQWFESLPARFQREWLGESRFKLYKEGGYTIDKFVDPRGKEYTLDDLRQKDAETFAEVLGP